MTLSPDQAARSLVPAHLTHAGGVGAQAAEFSIIDGKLTPYLSHAEPTDRADCLPAPTGRFDRTIRAYVPGEPILDGSYLFPDVVRLVE